MRSRVPGFSYLIRAPPSLSTFTFESPSCHPKSTPSSPGAFLPASSLRKMNQSNSTDESSFLLYGSPRTLLDNSIGHGVRLRGRTSIPLHASIGSLELRIARDALTLHLRFSSSGMALFQQSLLFRTRGAGKNPQSLSRDLLISVFNCVHGGPGLSSRFDRMNKMAGRWRRVRNTCHGNYNELPFFVARYGCETMESSHNNVIRSIWAIHGGTVVFATFGRWQKLHSDLPAGKNSGKSVDV